MPLPQFSKTGLTTLVFSRGNLYPVRRPKMYHQLRAQSEAGVVRVSTLRVPETLFVLHFERLPEADFLALDAWLAAAPVTGSAEPSPYTDVADTGPTVPWWPSDGDATFDMVQVAFGLYTVDLPLRLEVP